MADERVKQCRIIALHSIFLSSFPSADWHIVLMTHGHFVLESLIIIPQSETSSGRWESIHYSGQLMHSGFTHSPTFWTFSLNHDPLLSLRKMKDANIQMTFSSPQLTCHLCFGSFLLCPNNVTVKDIYTTPTNRVNWYFKAQDWTLALILTNPEQSNRHLVFLSLKKNIYIFPRIV